MKPQTDQVAAGGTEREGSEPVTVPAASTRGLRAQARAFVVPLLGQALLYSSEPMLSHADAVADILQSTGSSESIQAAAYLSYAIDHLNHPQQALAAKFGDDLARLAIEAARLERVQQRSRSGQEEAASDSERAREQTEVVRKMLLAFSHDLRVVLLRLASRLQTLRFCADAGGPVPPDILHEARDVLAPLANRLGIWQIKWQMEDLVLRAEDPATYRDIAQRLKLKRSEREAELEQQRRELEQGLRAAGIGAEVAGRPKNISSIVRKMRGKGLSFEQVFDVRALRVLVDTVADCYAVLDWVHERFEAIPGEFDDYIAKPKANGYQSLHLVVRDSHGHPWEIQIRTHDMHQHAESGVAAHWAYKEAGSRGYAGVSASGQYDAKIAVLRQLLAWERDFSGRALEHGLLDDRIYVLTPDAAVVELPAGATAVDFAYAVHTELGHRCRGARVDGAQVALNTPLKNGQTVSVTTVKEGGPSRDWLNPELGYLASPRARAKVRAWFNAQRQRETIARGRETVEKMLQREGRTGFALDQLATELGFKTPDALFDAVGKDELSTRSMEAVLRPAQHQNQGVAAVSQTVSQTVARRPAASPGGVLVQGMGALMTQPAGCCKPAPPDPIVGYVTRGRGVSVHRLDCPSVQQLRQRAPERVIEVSWGRPDKGNAPTYPVDVIVRASERSGLQRDVSDLFAREKMPVSALKSSPSGDGARIVLTVLVDDTRRLNQVLRQVRAVPGVQTASRR